MFYLGLFYLGQSGAMCIVLLRVLSREVLLHIPFLLHQITSVLL